MPFGFHLKSSLAAFKRFVPMFTALETPVVTGPTATTFAILRLLLADGK